MNNGLSERDIDTICAIFSKYPGIEHVYLFGSRAMGSFKPGSDIDLVIMDAVDRSVIKALINDFEESDLPYLIDLINYNTLTQLELLNHIDTYGVPFYSK